jgi:hypothetical protein
MIFPQKKTQRGVFGRRGGCAAWMRVCSIDECLSTSDVRPVSQATGKVDLCTKHRRKIQRGDSAAKNCTSQARDGGEGLHGVGSGTIHHFSPPLMLLEGSSGGENVGAARVSCKRRHSQTEEVYGNGGASQPPGRSKMPLAASSTSNSSIRVRDMGHAVDGKENQTRNGCPGNVLMATSAPGGCSPSTTRVPPSSPNHVQHPSHGLGNEVRHPQCTHASPQTTPLCG